MNCTVYVESDVWEMQNILYSTLSADKSWPTSTEIKQTNSEQGRFQIVLIAAGKDLLRAENGDNPSLSPEERNVWTGWTGICLRPY